MIAHASGAAIRIPFRRSRVGLKLKANTDLDVPRRSIQAAAAEVVTPDGDAVNENFMAEELAALMEPANVSPTVED